MVSIVSIYQSGFQILLQDDENYLHLQGNNSQDQTLIEVFNNLSFRLQCNESVLQFKSNSKGIVIHTSAQRLFMLYHQQSDNPNLIEFPIPATTFSDPGKPESENYDYKLSAQQLLEMEFKPNISPRAQPMPIPTSIHKMSFFDVNAIVMGKNIKILVIPNRILVHEFVNCSKKSTLHDTFPLKPSSQLHNCYDVKLPIISTDYFVTHDLLCIHYKTSYHVLLPEITNAGIKYIRFEWKATIKKDQIFWNKINDGLYVKDEAQNIYIYDIKTRQLELSLETQIPYPFLKSFDRFQSLPEIANINYVYNRPGFGTLTILHCDPNSSFGYGKHDKSVIINTSGLKYYGIINDRFAYISNGKLNILNTNTVELVVKSFDLPCLESSIIKSAINITITIETADAIYYGYLFGALKQFQFTSINRIIRPQLKPGIDISETINRYYQLPRRSREYEYETFRIDHQKFILDGFLARISRVNLYKKHSISFGSGRDWASGSGSKRMAITFVLKTFAAKYLITHNFMTSLNIDALSKCSDKELANMGCLLLFCYNTINCLTIHLPLLLIAAIQRRLPTVAALEFFAKHEDYESFTQLFKIKDSKSALAEAGFDNYSDGLNLVSKFDIQYDSKIMAYSIARKIADGFLSNIKNSGIFETNLATFDFCLSGDYHLNIKSFLSNVYFCSKLTYTQRQLISKYIEGLSQQQFRKLLINWGGVSTIKPNSAYQIFIRDNNYYLNIHFESCYTTIYITESLFDVVPVEEWNALFIDECMHVAG